MELPKNITQIGEVGRDCKIYAEDYVISYLKQLNRTARDKESAAALYGRRREENGIVYFFLYGACQLTLLQREVRHLSQAQYQEIERLRKRYFPEYLFLGYRLLDGEMIEGFHICEQEICRYIAGYAQFYEKNDPMLSYMLEVRREAEPEKVDQEKYEEVKKRQEERRAATESQSRARRREESVARKNAERPRSAPSPERSRRMRIAVASAFALLALLGFVTLQKDGSRDEGLQASAKQWIDGLMQQQLPDDGEAIATSGNVAQKDVLMMEDKLDQALLEENRAAENRTDAQTKPEEQEESAAAPEPESPTAAQSGEEQEGEAAEVAQNPDEGAEIAEEMVPVDAPASVEAPETESVAYVIQTGDTLIGISRRQYGSESRVSDICSVNKIANPDDIKVGQVIMLPK